MPVVVNLRTNPGTALVNQDYEDFQGSVTVSPGQLSTILNIQTWSYAPTIADKQFALEAVSISSGQIIQKEGVGLIKASQQVLKVKAISGGTIHRCAITAQDTLKCWGGNTYGALGNNTTTDSIFPVDVLNVNAVAVSSGGYHTCALTAQNTVKCWGYNFQGQLGNNSTTNSSVAVDVVGLTGIKSISSGGYHTCAITAQDTVKCWGEVCLS